LVLERLAIAALVTAGALAVQQPRFEVVAIRPVPPDAPLFMREQTFTPVLPGGQFVDPRTNLFSMIWFAYQVEDAPIRLLGLPDWARDRSFSVSAKPAPGFPALAPSANREQVREMMRAMLEARFHLKLHTETREGPVYVLEVAKGGLKFKNVDSPAPPEQEGPVNAAVGDNGGRIIGKKSTMAGMARMLVVFLRKPVVDRTGLDGYYDFDVKWSSPESPDADGFGVAGGALLISTLRDRFGLRLTSTHAPVKYWVVDHVEPPAEN
jgi:uncharacterized protein (TIGR03435 family)